MNLLLTSLNFADTYFWDINNFEIQGNGTISGNSGKVEGIQVNGCFFENDIFDWMVDGKVCILFYLIQIGPYFDFFFVTLEYQF